MLPDRVSNQGPLTYESGSLPIALRGPAMKSVVTLIDRPHITMDVKQQNGNSQAQCWKTSCQC